MDNLQWAVCRVVGFYIFAALAFIACMNLLAGHIPVEDLTSIRFVNTLILAAIIGAVAYRDFAAIQHANDTSAQLTQLVELLPGGVFLVYNRRYVFANHEAARLLGLSSADSILGKRVGTLAPQDDTSELERWAADVLRTGMRAAIRTTLQRPGGEAIAVEMRAAAVPWRGQVALLIFIVDTTEEIRTAEEYTALRNQVTENERRASIGLLAGGVAHDFNNLLTAILGNAQLALVDLPASSPAHECVVALLRTVRDAHDLVRQMLVYAGRGNAIMQHVEVNALIDGLLKLLRTSVHRKIKLESRIGADLLLVMSDAAQLRQVILNLVLNAADAIGDSHGHVCVSANLTHSNEQDGMPAGDYVLIRVRDNGVGMSAETRSHIFEPFYTTKPTGRGIGLATVQAIVAAHGGAIEVESRQGAGSVFTIRLPAASAAGSLEEVSVGR